MTILKHELKQNLRSLLIWSGILGGLTLMFMLMFPALKNQMDKIVDAYSNMGNFSVAFGMDKISFTSAMGFYGIEAGTMISIGGAMFAALTGISSLSKEESNHTAEFLFTHPVSRISIISQKLLFIILQLISFNVIYIIVAMISFGIIGEDLQFKEFMLFHFAQLIMQFEIACICFGVSAFQRHQYVGIGLGFAIILYFLSLLTNISDKVDFLKYITPYQYSDAANIISKGKLEGNLILIGLIIAIIFVCISYVKYSRKDLAS